MKGLIASSAIISLASFVAVAAVVVVIAGDDWTGCDVIISDFMIGDTMAMFDGSVLGYNRVVTNTIII